MLIFTDTGHLISELVLLRWPLNFVV